MLPADLPPTTWKEDQVPTNDQLADWLMQLNRSQMLWWVERIQPLADAGSRCLVLDHENRIQAIELLPELVTTVDQMIGTSHEPISTSSGTPAGS